MVSVEIVIVPLGLNADRLAACACRLDPGEAERAERFQRPADRARFIASHAALRLVLGRATVTAPEALTFAAGDGGRPYLAGSTEAGLDFNLSHSGDIALIGIARGARVGVDVEAYRPLPDAMRIARGHFAPDELASLTALPSRRAQEAFFGLWTRKEAVVKALGAGLSLPLDRFSVSVPPASPTMLRIAGGAESWTIADIDAGPTVCASAAVMASEADIHAATLPTTWADDFAGK